MEFNETDLAAVGKIQEVRNCTIEKAKQLFRQQVNKLANPEVENRADLVLAAVERGAAVATDDEVEAATASAKPKMTRNERRLERRKKAEMKAKEKKAKKAKAPKAAKSPRKKAAASTPRVEVELAKLEREIQLTPVDEFPNVYTANILGRKHVVNWQEINRTQGVAQRFNAVTMSNKRMDAAQKYAKGNDLPLAFCVTVRVLGKLDQGYAVPAELFNKFKQKQGPNWGFSLAHAARLAYREGGWDNCKFSEKSAESKAA